MKRIFENKNEWLSSNELKPGMVGLLKIKPEIAFRKFWFTESDVEFVIENIFTYEELMNRKDNDTDKSLFLKSDFWARLSHDNIARGVITMSSPSLQKYMNRTILFVKILGEKEHVEQDGSSHTVPSIIRAFVMYGYCEHNMTINGNVLVERYRYENSNKLQNTNDQTGIFESFEKGLYDMDKYLYPTEVKPNMTGEINLITKTQTSRYPFSFSREHKHKFYVLNIFKIRDIINPNYVNDDAFYNAKMFRESFEQSDLYEKLIHIYKDVSKFPTYILEDYVIKIQIDQSVKMYFAIYGSSVLNTTITHDSLLVPRWNLTNREKTKNVNDQTGLFESNGYLFYEWCLRAMEYCNIWFSVQKSHKFGGRCFFISPKKGNAKFEIEVRENKDDVLCFVEKHADPIKLNNDLNALINYVAISMTDVNKILHGTDELEKSVKLRHFYVTMLWKKICTMDKIYKIECPSDILQKFDNSNFGKAAGIGVFESLEEDEDFLLPSEVKPNMLVTYDDVEFIVVYVWHGIDELEKFIKEKRNDFYLSVDADDQQKNNYAFMIKHRDVYKNRTICAIFENIDSSQTLDNEFWMFAIYGMDRNINQKNAGIDGDFVFKIPATQRWKTSNRLKHNDDKTGIFN